VNAAQRPSTSAGASRPWRPPGAGSPRSERLDEIQRDRIFDSLLAVLGKGGLPALTLNRVALNAGMSTRTFYAYFEDIDDCLLAAYRTYADQLGGELRDAWQAADRWPDKVRAALAAALAFAVRRPLVARFLAAEAQAGSCALRAAQAASIDALAAKLGEGRRLYPAAAGLNPLTERVMVAGAVALLGDRLLAGEFERLAALERELGERALAPYLRARLTRL